MKTPGQLRIHILERAAEDEEFRARLIDDPPGTIEKELGIGVPRGLKVTVQRENADTPSIVLERDARLEAAALEAVSASHFWSIAAGDDDNDRNDDNE